MDSSTKYSPLYDPKTDNAHIADEVQQMINKPLGGVAYSQEDQSFLDLILKLVNEKKINLYSPSSLLNNDIYEKLPHEGKAKADQNAMLILTKVREIYNLMQTITEPTYQVKNLVDSLRLNKESVEKTYGNIFII